MLADILTRYLEFYPEERSRLELLQKQINNDEKLNDRRNFTGHITAATIILSADKKKILLIHHKAYDQWQQPGGHWEKDESNPLEAAKREGEEETGIKPGKHLPMDSQHPLVPFDIDSHAVPARPAKNEPPHVHHDFRYVFITSETDLKHQVEEVLAVGWFDLDDPKTWSVERAIKKLRSRGIVA